MKLNRIRFTYRCAACGLENPSTVELRRGHRRRPSAVTRDRLLASLPEGWTALWCVSTKTDDVAAKWNLWFCPACSETPDQSRVVAAMRHPVRIESRVLVALRLGVRILS